MKQVISAQLVSDDCSGPREVKGIDLELTGRLLGEAGRWQRKDRNEGTEDS